MSDRRAERQAKAAARRHEILRGRPVVAAEHYVRLEAPGDMDQLVTAAPGADGEVAWSCRYYDFPVVRIDRNVVTGWTNAVQGGRALAVADERILLAGGYGADRDRLVEGRLVGDELKIVSESRLTLPDGAELAPTTFLVGCGPDLFAIAGRDCFRLSLR